MQKINSRLFRIKQVGVTLLEAMLVLAIGSMLLVFAIKQYQQFKAQQDLQQLQLNIDKLFLALGHYYQAYCNSGQLASSSTNFIVVTPAQLVSAGFLDANWNALSVPVATNYFSQLDLNPITNQHVQACWTTSNGMYTCGDQTTLYPASVYTWKVQVAVQLSSTADPQAYKAMLSADCLSTASGDQVEPCATSGNTGTVLVWERLPSFASPNILSNLWMSMPQLIQFNRQYTHDQMYELTYGAQPYLCGS